MRFVALTDFFSEETASQYHAGLGYTIDNDKLAALVEKWISEGKVSLGGPAAMMTGSGTVGG
jgi:hypothetical protein